MKKLLCLLSAFAVFIISGCTSKPSEAPLFEKYVAEGTKYPVKIVWEGLYYSYDSIEPIECVTTSYILSPDKFYYSQDFGDETSDFLYDGNVMYSIDHTEKAAFASPLNPGDAEEMGEIYIAYIPTHPENWALTEKGEAQYEGNTYLYETAVCKNGENEYFLTLYADPESNEIKYVSDHNTEELTRFVEMTHSFDLRIFEIPDDYEIVNMPGAK